MNFDHKKLLEKIAKLGEIPCGEADYAQWIRAEAHLAFLRENALADEIIVYAAGAYTYMHSTVVPNDQLTRLNQEGLMNLGFRPDEPVASYTTGGGNEDVWITWNMKEATQLVFSRRFEGWCGPGEHYFELNQEYAHLAGIHWRQEKHAYCRYDGYGDLDFIVTITNHDDKHNNIDVVSFKWEPLEEYLATSNASLVRKFDFTLLRPGRFPGWSQNAPEDFHETDELFYKQKIDGEAAYTHGIQIIRPRRPSETIFKGITDAWFGRKNKQYAEFIANDWRNGRIAKISTDPRATCNYFGSEGNTLPFELSPAFFRPEVLLKYKTDRDKYTVGERDISCRAAWHLEGIDINEAGQVHAYICDLRRLPYTEQLHWLSYNEAPKADISQRAVINDFKGEFVTFMQPLRKVISIVRRWYENEVSWWTLRDRKLLERVNTPVTASRDEWAEAFMDLAKLVVEGFELKAIREKLEVKQVEYGKDDKTINLLERLLHKNGTLDRNQKLNGLRTVQNLRSKVKGHAGGNDADQLAHDALMQHESYTNHFNSVCEMVAIDLSTIEESIS